LAAKQQLVKTGELKTRSWHDYDVAYARIIKVFGPGRCVADLGPRDFAKLRANLAKTHGPVALANDIGRARVAFNYTPAANWGSASEC